MMEKLTCEEIMIKLAEHKIVSHVVINNARHKSIDFCYKSLKPADDPPESEGFHQDSVIKFSGTIHFDCREGKVTSWDYDQDSDQAAAVQHKLHDFITELLN